MARASPALYTIAPGADVCATFVRALLDRHLLGLDFHADPLALADLVIYVPTLRLRHEIERAFRAYFDGRPTFLPAIRALAEPDDPLETFGEASAARDGGKRVLTAAERAYRLHPLVASWLAKVQEGAADPDGTDPTGVGSSLGTPRVAEALRFAQALGLLIDETRISGLDPSILTQAVPAGYDPAAHDAYWRMSLDFLAIAGKAWPEFLAEAGAMDDSEARLEAIAAEGRRLAQGGHFAQDGQLDQGGQAVQGRLRPAVVLGSTGSVPATAALMRAVSRLEHGAVILPGLDLGMDDRSWAALDHDQSGLATRFGHPQAVLKRTLRLLGAHRDAVEPLDAAAEAAPRNRLVSEALWPSETVEDWPAIRSKFPVAEALAGITLIEAADDHEEARAIAVLIRRHLATEAGRIVLMSADRSLARRVRAELARWAIDVTDSAGSPLSETDAGRFLRLMLQAVIIGDSPSLLAMMRHPLFALARNPVVSALPDQASPEGEACDVIAAFELIALRGHRFAADLALAERLRLALASKPSRVPRPVQRMLETGLGALPAFAKACDDVLAPLRTAPGASLSEWARRIEAAFQAMMAGPEVALAEASPERRDREAVLAVLTEMQALGGAIPASLDDAAAVIEDLLRTRTLPEPAGRGMRALIVGPLESRLISAECVIIAGLNEGSIPPSAPDDPFLTRAMRLALGLQPPERRIGQNAHDVTMLMGAPRLVLTRARRAGGQPTLPSRFLRRLEAFLGEGAWTALRDTGASILRGGAALDSPRGYAPVAEPQPRPAAPGLPPSLSITEIETLIRDPYTLYARHILGLDPLEALDPEPDGRDFGTLLHACLDAIAKADLPKDDEEAFTSFREIGQKVFAPFAGEPDVMQFWWQRYLSIFPDILAFERGGRATSAERLSECRGEVVFSLPCGQRFRLAGKADRLDRAASGALSVYDFKTSKPPSAKSVLQGYSPQLPLTAAMALQGAFPGLRVGDIGQLAYIHAAPGFKHVVITPEPEDTLAGLIDRQWQATVQRLDAFARGDLAYRAQVRVSPSAHPGAYAHLSRHAEWSSGVAATEAEEEET